MQISQGDYFTSTIENPRFVWTKLISKTCVNPVVFSNFTHECTGNFKITMSTRDLTINFAPPSQLALVFLSTRTLELNKFLFFRARDKNAIKLFTVNTHTLRLLKIVKYLKRRLLFTEPAKRHTANYVSLHMLWSEDYTADILSNINPG